MKRRLRDAQRGDCIVCHNMKQRRRCSHQIMERFVDASDPNHLDVDDHEKADSGYLFCRGIRRPTSFHLAGKHWRRAKLLDWLQ